jgi:outer membrane protein insertion porin family
MKTKTRIYSALVAGLLAVTANVSVMTVAHAQGYMAPTGQRINEVRVLGTERIEPSTVLTYMDVRVGDSMTEETLDNALKSLFGTGLFADVTLRQKGNVLEVTVLENPVISQIAFEGNDKISDDELLAEIQMRPRQVLTRNKVQADVNRLYQVYQRNGRFSVNIEPKVIKLDQNRVNLVFEVTEGDVTVIEGVRFVGNQAYDDDKLRSEISTKEDRWYRFLATDDRYDPDRVKYDEEMLRKFYLSQGYADFRVVSSTAELSKERDGFYLTFMIEEGQRYHVGDVKIRSTLRNFDATVLAPELTFKEGEWYNASEIEASIDTLTKKLEENQFTFVNVKPETTRRRDQLLVDITFNITESTPVYVERIDVSGNVRTLDKVIRREFALSEGDPFNKTKLAKSEQNIRDLGYFETVSVQNKQGSAPDKTVVNVDVAEKSTGELSIGAGFSTADGPLADFRIRERNFLGKGQDVTLAATVAGERTEFDFSFTEPYFLDRDFSAGVDLFHITRDLQDESSYDSRRTGGALRFGYPLSEHWRQSLRYRIEQNEITDVQSDASRFIRDQEGERVTSAVSQRITYDDRDSVLFPTNGMNAWFDTEWAGLGGDASYLSAQVGASWFYPIADRWILNVLGETGVISGLSEDVEINERYFLGGATLRGFERAGIGPRDPATDDSLGGNYFYRGTVEMSFPIGFPEEMGILGHGFTDIGSLWDLDETDPTILDESSIRGAAGLGVSWRSPMGPVRADVSVPYAKEDYDREEVFRFSFGTRF